MRSLLCLLVCNLLFSAAFASGYDTVLKQRLDSITVKDQLYRGLLTELPDMTPEKKDSLAKRFSVVAGYLETYLWQQQTKLDKANLQAVESIISKVGYPGLSMVGEPTNEAAWYVIQHSSKIKEYFPLIKEAGRKREIPLYLVAKMEDRLLVQENKPQLYGTQACTIYQYDSLTDDITEIYYIMPVADPMNINERRRKAGFKDPIEKDAESLGAVYDKDITREDFSRSVIVESSIKSTPEKRERIRYAKTITLPAKELDSSSFRFLQLADSFARIKDAARAALCFQHVEPYHILFLVDDAADIDKYLSQFCFSAKEKEKYKKTFNLTYNSNKPAVYDTLRKFYLKLRLLDDNILSEDPYVSAKAEKDIEQADSAVMAYLHSYVMEHGWPTMQQGSLYAAYIAGRDIGHYYDYLPLVKNAFLEGRVPLYMVKKIAGNEQYYYDYVQVKGRLKPRYQRFDVTPYIKLQGVGVMHSIDMKNEIFSAMRAHCPVKGYMFVHYTNKRWQHKEFSAEAACNRYCGHEFLSLLGDACHKRGFSMLEHFELPETPKGEKEYFYIIYQ